MLLSVIIPTHNRPQQLRELLRSIKLSFVDFKKPEEIEIIVVSNFNDSRVKKCVDNYRSHNYKMTYAFTGSQGVNKARNKGTRIAQGKILLFLDDDCYINNPDFFKKVIASHKKYPAASAIGGRYSLKGKASLVEWAYHINTDDWLTNSKIFENNTTQLVGGNMSFKAEVLANRFKFNEKIKFGGSESELNARLIMSGHQLILDENLSIEHRLKVSFLSLIKKSFAQGKGKKIRELLEKENSTPQKYIISSPPHKYGNIIEKILIPLYLSIFNFFFRVGYRQASKYANTSNSYLSLITSILDELQSKDNQFALKDTKQETPYHFHKYPAWKFKAYFHWIRWRLLQIRWQLLQVFHFFKKNIPRYMKPYYVLEYQLSKNKFLRKIFGKYHSTDFAKKLKEP